MALEPVSFSDRETSEDWLQQQINEHPELLPIGDVGPAWGPLVSLGREIPLSVGFVDNLYVSPAGEVTVVEAKLWRNPEARRKVIGQILDYASALAALSYEELDEVVREASPDDDRSIWQRLLDSAYAPEVDSGARFVERSAGTCGWVASCFSWSAMASARTCAASRRSSARSRPSASISSWSSSGCIACPTATFWRFRV